MSARTRPCGTLSVSASGASAFAFPPRAASTSRLVTRPPGPLPAISLRRIPFSPARRRASGEARRPPGSRPSVSGSGAASAAGAGPSAGGASGAAGGALGRGGDPLQGLVRRPDHRDGGAHGDARPLRHQQPANRAAGRGLHLDRGLVGLDLRQDLSLFYLFTFGTQPAHQLALGHVETEFRHGDDFGHHSTSFTARTTSETCGRAICSRVRLYGRGASFWATRRMGAST